jgi:hypothetical protein
MNMIQSFCPQNHFDLRFGLEGCTANAATGLSRDVVEFVEDDEEHQGENIYVPGKVQFEACLWQMPQEIDRPRLFRMCRTCGW